MDDKNLRHLRSLGDRQQDDNAIVPYLLNSGFCVCYDSHVTTRETYLERIDHARNMARYYRLSVVKTLFGEWAMVREWGRIGRQGQSREHVCGSYDQATTLLEARRAERMKRGYR